MSTIKETFVGVDICEDHLDVFILSDGLYKRFDNNEEGIKTLISLLDSYKVKAVIMEGTGGLQRKLYSSLRNASMSAYVVNPERIWAYKRTIAKHAKTDKIDAQVLAEFGERMPLKEVRPLSEHELQMQELSSRRTQISDTLSAEKQRLRRVSNAEVISSLKEGIKHLEKQLSSIEKSMHKAICQDEEKKRNMKILSSIPGIGRVTSMYLIIDMPELGSISDKEIASLAGVAPVPNQSGKSKGKSHIYGGRKHVRKKLYMCALTALTWNPEIQRFFKRLEDKGKCFKQAITACMRKMLIYANRTIATQTMWIEKEQPSS